MSENEIALPLSVSVLAGAQNNVLVRTDTPFSSMRAEFLDTLSKILLTKPHVRQFSDVVSFAFWCRKASISKKNLKWNERSGGKLSLGRGFAFHIAPSNVPVNFAFSFAFSLLAGNANIVRVPTKAFAQIDIICEALEEAFQQYPELQVSNSFIRYEKKDEISAHFSLASDCRILWGGDATVDVIRRLPCRPRCIDVVFPDRYSVAVMNEKSVSALDEQGLHKLALDFYNDTYLMDQNACSSPQIVFWYEKDAEGRAKFWSALGAIAREKYELQNAVAFEKYVHLCEDILEGYDNEVLNEFDSYLTRVNISNLISQDSDEVSLSDLRGQGGYFYEADISAISDIVPFVSRKYQSLVYFGIDPKKLAKDIVGAKPQGIDRIVPVGTAMDIDLIWDGYDIVGELSRIVDVR